MSSDPIREQQRMVDGLAFKVRCDGMIVDRIRTLERALQDAKTALNVMLKQVGSGAQLRGYNRDRGTIETVNAELWLKGEIAQIERLFPPSQPTTDTPPNPL